MDGRDYTVITTPFAEPVVRGDPRQVVLSSYEVIQTPFGPVTEEHYQVAAGGLDIAKAFMDDCLLDERCMDVSRKIPTGETITIDVTWGFDADTLDWEPGIDTPLWDFDVMDTSTQLAQHPYFGRNLALSDADAQALALEMGAVDQSFANGKTYAVQDPSISDAVQEIIARYAGLRAAGVDEFNPIMVMLSRRRRMFVTQDETASILSDINRSVNIEAYSPPVFVLEVLNGLSAWVYDGTTGSPIPTTTGYAFSWVRVKPVVKLSGTNPNGPYDVTEYFLGVQDVAQVLCPPLESVADGWDPYYDIWKYYEE